MRKSSILLIMPWPQYVEKAAALGFAVHVIADPALDSPANLERSYAAAGTFRLASFDDVTELCALIERTVREYDIEHVLHFGHESTQVPVSECAATLGRSLNPPSAVATINDKTLLRALLHREGLSPVRTRAFDSPEAAVAGLAGFPLPAVAKPARLDGSRGVRLILAPADIECWAATVTGDYGYTGPVLVEEFLIGPEMSVETLSVDGTHTVVGVTQKEAGPPTFVERGHVFPAALPAPLYRAVADLTVALLTAAGYRFGPCHTEIILTRSGPRIVESQTRFGGDRITRLIEVATGFDMEAALFAALAGEPVGPVPPNARLGVVSFFDLPSGRVTGIGDLEPIRRLPFVHELTFKPVVGDLVTEPTDSAGRPGFVVLDAADRAEAAVRLREIRRLLTVRVKEDPR